MDTRTEEILARFNKSWLETEKFYDNLIDNYPGWDRLKPLRNYIAKLKENGGNKYFRLGTSIHLLIISRSVDNRLRDEQKYIRIDTLDFDDYEVTMKDGNKIYREYRITNLEDPRLEKLLKTLKSTLAD